MKHIRLSFELVKKMKTTLFQQNVWALEKLVLVDNFVMTASVRMKQSHHFVMTLEQMLELKSQNHADAKILKMQHVQPEITVQVLAHAVKLHQVTCFKSKTQHLNESWGKRQKCKKFVYLNYSNKFSIKCHKSREKIFNCGVNHKGNFLGLNLVSFFDSHKHSEFDTCNFLFFC